MNNKDQNVVTFPGGGPPREVEAANDSNPSEVSESTSLFAHRLKYGFRLVLSIVLMWLQGPLGFICRLLSFVVWAGFFVLLIFAKINAGPLFLMASVAFFLFLLPMLFEFLVYWVMPTK